MQRIKIEELEQKLKQLQLDNEIKKLKQKSIYTTGQVSQLCYTEGNDSPTESDFIDPHLSVSPKSFVPSYNDLNNEMMSLKNVDKLIEYRNTHTKEEKLDIYNKWKEMMIDTETNIQFFYFVEKYYPKIKWLKTLTKEKFIKTDGTITVASHPPAKNIKFNHRNNLIVASSFKTPTKDSKVNKIIEQSNYTNESLIMIGKQLDEIEIKINNSKCLENHKKEQPLVKF